jgi:glycosyltransferase involved in cell wall biosynthesis
MQSGDPLVSIVIATYNGARYLREQMASVLAQTYPSMEIIAIDDCSSDDTVAILHEIVGSDSRIKIFRNEANLGHIKTFERGISLCSGEYISLCDQDDAWDTNKVRAMMDAWEDDADLIYCDSLFVDESGNSLGRKVSDIKNLTSYTSAIPFIIGNTVPGHAAMFTKELARQTMPFPSAIIHDWWLAFVAAANGKVQFFDKPLVKYRQHSGNVIGAIKVKGRKKKSKEDKQALIRERVGLFYKICPASSDAKEVLQEVVRSYASFSLVNNWRRMMVFFKYQEQLLATKKRSPFRKWLFCVKMFFTIQ